jgi:hypothetical protein
MKIYIPIKVSESIKFTIDKEIDFINLTEKQKFNLNKVLTSLWFFIYNEQRKDEQIVNFKGFTNIHSDFLKRFRIKIDNKSYHYNKLLTLLKDVNLITINEKFSAGNFSQSYRIETEFLQAKFTEVEIDFDKIFNNLKNKSYWLKKYPTHSKQIKETYEVKIDLADYIEWLKSNINLELKPIISNGRLETRFLTQDKIYDYINDALMINYDNIWFKVSDEGRFYNSLTNLSYTALPFIKLKRRKIKELDIANCQPLLLNKFVDNKEYKKDCELGLFYDKLSKEIGTSRNEAKILSYKYIFFTNKRLKSGKLYDAMEKLYSGLIQQINELRTKIEISKELQKIESDIFVNKISNLDFKMMLRHDAVFVYEEDYDIIKNYIIKEFIKIGLNPTIK